MKVWIVTKDAEDGCCGFDYIEDLGGVFSTRDAAAAWIREHAEKGFAYWIAEWQVDGDCVSRAIRLI